VVEGLIRRLISENAQVGFDSYEYARCEAALVDRYDAAKDSMTDIKTQIQGRKKPPYKAGCVHPGTGKTGWVDFCF
jgi:hypothetical protein